MDKKELEAIKEQCEIDMYMDTDIVLKIIQMVEKQQKEIENLKKQITDEREKWV